MEKIIIAGGGFFGLYLAYYFGKRKYNVSLYEKNSDVMMRASYHNQARVHNGYHYPRSVLTALRSRQSFPRFVEDFSECIYDEFEKYYMVAKHLSKVNSLQFKKFCKRIGAPIEDAPSKIKSLINSKFIESCFAAREFAFDALKLKKVILQNIDPDFVSLKLNSEVCRVQRGSRGIEAEVEDRQTGARESFRASHIFNCTYANLNKIPHESCLELIPLKYEMTEMAIVDVPYELKQVGITVMCGPFFSVMPFPAIGEGSGSHSFSHVRYTPHYEWLADAKRYQDVDWKFEHDERHSAWKLMRQDAARYIPILADCVYKQSLWEIKTVLPRSEVDDSRPILCKFNHGIEGFHSVMGGKIDNVYDAVAAIHKEIGL